jgi:hypothetical protein
MKKKAPKFEYGIEITKPWSKAMYDHNDEVADTVRDIVCKKWSDAYARAEVEFLDGLEEDQIGLDFDDQEYSHGATNELVEIQQAVTVYSIGSGYDMIDIDTEVLKDLEDAPYYRLKEITEELELELTEGFVGLN